MSGEKTSKIHNYPSLLNPWFTILPISKVSNTLICPNIGFTWVHNNPSNGKTTTICHKLEGCPVFRHTVGYKHPNICGGCSNLWYPKAALTPPFRAPAELGQGIMITFSCAYFGKNIDRRIVLKTFKNKWKHLPKSFYRLPLS